MHQGKNFLGLADLIYCIICSCIVTHVHTHAYTHTAHTASPQFTSQPKNTTVTESTVAVLECSATGNPAPIITWYKDNSQVSLNGRVSQRLGQDLYITNVQSNSDEGIYYCVATNIASSIRSISATLKILCKS